MAIIDLRRLEVNASLDCLNDEASFPIHVIVPNIDDSWRRWLIEHLGSVEHPSETLAREHSLDPSVRYQSCSICRGASVEKNVLSAEFLGFAQQVEELIHRESARLRVDPNPVLEQPVPAPSRVR